MVLCAAEHHEITAAVPVRFAELPKGAADRIDPARRHIHRAETSMGGIVGCAELRGPPAGESLALIPAREESEFSRVLVSDPAEPQCRRFQGLVPSDFPKGRRAAFPDPF